MREADWLDIRTALSIMLEGAAPLSSERVPLDQARGRTLAEDVIAPVDQPPWDNSAMDGFAIRSSDVTGATLPIRLEVVDNIPAGAMPTRAVQSGQAARIMTGAPMPEGADGVIRVEHTRMISDTHVEILRDNDVGRNVRFRGEDVRRGAVVLKRGRHLRPAEIGLLAMVACDRPLVYRRPRVAVIATGDELVEPDRIEDVRAGTHIVNSNTPALVAGLEATGCDAVPLGIARDDLEDLRARLRMALPTDALITTAGASVGDHDLVKDALEELGCETVFWRVKIRPGSPFSYGSLKTPDGRVIPVFGLPGNPVSALVTFEILVRPVLRALQGRSQVYPPVARAVAGADIRSPTGLMRFLRVRLDHGGDSLPRAYLTGPQGSGILTSVAAADALLVVPIETELIRAGEVVRIVPLRTGDEAQEDLDLN